MELDRVDSIIDSHGAETGSLIQVLLDIQAELGWLPKDALDRVAQRLEVPVTRIRHVATFYKAFSLVPKGRHRIHVCMGTACHVRGAQRILDTIEEVIGIRPGETDTELKFSLETVNCLGCCALGPVVEIDRDVHGNVSSSKVQDMLKGYE